MTNPSTHRQRGFTLIELLVVIAIIAVLASAGFAGGMAALQRARKTTALNTATAIEQAVSNFYNEYGYLPYEGSPSADIVVPTNNAAGTTLLRVLTGQETNPSLNNKSINFLSLKEGKGTATAGRDGVIYTSNIPTALFDPWGGPYYVILNTNYDEKIDASVIVPKAGNKNNLNARNVAVWTNGADGVTAGQGKATDDVATW